MWIRSCFIFLLLVLGALPILGGHVRYAGSDAKGIAVVAQQLLKTGNLSLEGKYADFFDPKPGMLDHHTIPLNGRREYFFPLGPVLLALPFVATENLFGTDFTARKADWKLQQKLVVLVALAILALFYGFLRSAFSPVAALSVSFGLFYGSVLAPTVAGAFWSIDSEIVVTGLVIFMMWPGTRALGAGRALLIGILLFLGFLCRPTFATFILPVFLYLALRDRRALLYAASVSAALLANFVVFSERHYGSYLPPYYLASRLSAKGAWAALQGLSFSPSRGVVVFCPFLIMLVLYARRVSQSRNPALLTALALAMVLQFASCTTFSMWWGGESFGPRIMANFAFLGGVILIGLIGALRGRERSIAGGVLAVLSVVGMCINLPGVFDDCTRLWNEFPSADADPGVFFDWRFPQFLSVSRARLVEKCLAQSAVQGAATAACP